MAGITWRPASSLATLKNQLDAKYPGWLFLGFLGDQSHTTVASDHNPNSAGVVTALDIGPGGGLDIHALARRLATNPHPNLKYIISKGEIFEWQNGFKAREYNGSDPHDTHIHISVGRGPDGSSQQPYDDKTNWNIGGEAMPTPKQVGDIYRAMTGNEISQKDLDFYITPPRTVYDLIYALFPATQKARNVIKLLEEDRDKNLYPAVERLNQLLKTDPVKKLDEVKKIASQLQETLK